MDIKTYTLDPLALISETRFNSVTAVMTIDRLALCVPKDATADEKKAVKAMIAARDTIEGVREDRATRQPSKLRPFLLRNNAAWAGLASVLAAKAGLSPDVAGDKPGRAEKLQSDLFPEDGGPELKTDAETSYVQARERVERIDREKLAHEISEIAGAEHLDEVRAATEALGEALGVGSKARTTPNGTAMPDALRGASKAVGVYGRKLVGHLDEDDEASVKRFVDALAPLAEYKASLARGTVDDSGDNAGDGTTATTPNSPATPPTPAS